MYIGFSFLVFFVLIKNGSFLKIHGNFQKCEPSTLQKNDKILIEALPQFPLNEFFEYSNNSKNIFYRSKTGSFFETNCLTVNEINVYRHSDKCFEDIPISYNESGNEIDAFLTKSGFIRKQSKKVDCSNDISTLIIKTFKFFKFKNLIEVIENVKISNKHNQAFIKSFNNLTNEIIQKIEVSNFDDREKEKLIILVSLVSIIIIPAVCVYASILCKNQKLNRYLFLFLVNL